MNYRRGHVILVRYPNSDLKTYKKRPALVIQSDSVDTDLNQKIVAMITSNIHRTGATRVFIKKESQLAKQMGLLGDSVVVADNLATIFEREIDKAIGYCEDTKHIDQALRKVLAL